MQTTVSINILINVHQGIFFPRKDFFLELIFKLLFCHDLHYIMKKLPQPVLTGMQVVLFTKYRANETKKMRFFPDIIS